MEDYKEVKGCTETAYEAWKLIRMIFIIVIIYLILYVLVVKPLTPSIDDSGGPETASEAVSTEDAVSLTYESEAK